METRFNIVLTTFYEEKKKTRKKLSPCQMLHRPLLTVVVGMVYVDLHADVIGFIR